VTGSTERPVHTAEGRKRTGRDEAALGASPPAGPPSEWHGRERQAGADSTWQIQEGKQRFSELIRAAVSDGPQFITKHGEEIAVVVDIDTFHRIRQSPPERTLVDHLVDGPAADELPELLEGLRRELNLRGTARNAQLQQIMQDLAGDFEPNGPDLPDDREADLPRGARPDPTQGQAAAAAGSSGPDGTTAAGSGEHGSQSSPPGGREQA
jgi:prevent-host-death family protein